MMGMQHNLLGMCLLKIILNICMKSDVQVTKISRYFVGQHLSITMAKNAQNIQIVQNFWLKRE